MGALILAGQDLVAGTGAGQLNERYGFADATPATVTAASFANLCTPYVIPAGEAYAGAAYELSCAGDGVWGSTQQTLALSMFLGSAFGTAPTPGATMLNASVAFQYSLIMRLTCVDGVNQWWGDISGAVVAATATILPGNAAANACAIAGVNTGVHLASVSGALTAVIQAKWGSTTGAPTITNLKTTFKKVA